MPVCARPGSHFRLIFAGASRIGSDNFCLKYSCNMVIIINVHFVGLFIVVYVNNDWMFMGTVPRLYVLIPKKKMFYKHFYFCILWIFCHKNTNRQNKN